MATNNTETHDKWQNLLEVFVRAKPTRPVSPTQTKGSYLALRTLMLLPLAALAACTTGPEARTSRPAGPVSAYALNEIAEKDPQSLIRLGEGFERAGDYVGALRLYRQALAANPGMVDARAAQGRLFVKLGQLEQGITELEFAHTKQPDNISVAVHLMDAYILQKKYAEAAALITPLADKDGAQADVILRAAQALHILGAVDSSRTYLDKLLTNDNKDPQALSALAFNFALEGDFDTAVAVLQPMMDNAATAAVGRRSLATIYALSGQSEAAEHIAGTIVSEDDLRSLRPFYRLLPTLSGQEKAVAVYYERLPAHILAEPQQ